MPALVVAIVGNPQSSRSLALMQSQALGSTSNSSPWCNPRNRSAFALSTSKIPLLSQPTALPILHRCDFALIYHSSLIYYYRCERVVQDLENVARIAWALSDPVRLSVMLILMGGPAAVAELVSATGASQPNVSNHLRVLRDQGLVRSERRGRQAI